MKYNVQVCFVSQEVYDYAKSKNWNTDCLTVLNPIVVPKKKKPNNE